MAENVSERGTQAAVHPANVHGQDFTGDVAAVTIDRPAQELYAFWRKFENLQQISRNVISITPLDDKRTKWVVNGPGADKVEWISRVTEDEPGVRIAWCADEEADIENSGWIEFRQALGGRGTHVRASIDYDPPLGPIGDLGAKALRKDPGTLARIELRRFKQFMETGEVSTAEPHPAPARTN